MTPHVQYATAADGARIAYTVFGEGDGVPLVVLAPSMLSHVGAEWHLSPRIRAVRAIEPLARGRRMVRLDLRGCGLSDRELADYSVDARVGDVAAVVDRIGLDGFAIDAFSEAALTAIANAARHPVRVSHLVLTDAWLRGSGPWDTPRQRALHNLYEADWQLGTDAIGLMTFGWTEEAREFGAHARGCLRREEYLRIRAADVGLDVRPLLPRITAPTLV